MTIKYHIHLTVCEVKNYSNPSLFRKVKFKNWLRNGNHMIIRTEQYSCSDLMPPPELPVPEEARSSNDLQLQHRGDFPEFTRAINSIALGRLVPSLSLKSIQEVTEYLLEIDPEVVKIFLENKKDSIELSNLVDYYFQKHHQTLKFCTALDVCLKRGGHIESIMNVALRVFKEEHYSISGEGGVKIYPRTLEELRSLKAAVDPFIEFLELFTSVNKQQDLMTEKLEAKKRQLDKKLGKMKIRRKVSNVISICAFASVLTCSVAAAAVIAPPVVTALAAAATVPSWTMVKWLDSIFKKRMIDLRAKRVIICLMCIGTVIEKMDVDRFRNEIEALLESVDSAMREEGSMVIAVEEIQKKKIHEGWELNSTEDRKSKLCLAQKQQYESDGNIEEKIAIGKIKQRNSRENSKLEIGLN
ncbi:UPF0496 protein 1-like [Olea europaea var. sylvestris]|uniref:UPF0496 protein 1-like n=1 Tax=Olea europaea var. sylvestris TaxID=158386 RepID=UPI000C1CFBEC|nr:UPF0496 protein 1-like [Olea europaea var. sylvestris]